MSLPRRSRFTYDVAGDFTTELSVRAWIPEDATVGGRRISGAGVPVSYLVRRDDLLSLTPRIQEEEWSDFLTFLQFGQTSQPFYWWPDVVQTDPDYDRVQVYLETPAMGDRITPTRNGQYERVFELPITLRSVSGGLWLPYYGE